MIAGAGGAGREVQIVLKLIADGANGAAAKSVSDQAAGSASRVTRIHEDVAKRIHRIEADALGKNFEQQVSASKRIERLRIDTATKIARAEQDAAARNARAGEAAVAREDRQSYTRERGLMRQEILQERFHHKGIHGYLRMGESVVGVAKGLALMSGASEENLQHLAQTLAKWQGIGDVVSGSIRFYMTIADMTILQKREAAALLVQQHLLNAARAEGAAIEVGAGAIGGAAGGAARKGGAGIAGEVGGAAVGGIGGGAAVGAGIGLGLLTAIGLCTIGIAALGASILHVTGGFEYLGKTFSLFKKRIFGEGPPEWNQEENDKLVEFHKSVRERDKQREELIEKHRAGGLGQLEETHRGFLGGELGAAHNAAASAVGRYISHPNDSAARFSVAEKYSLLRRARIAAENPLQRDIDRAAEGVGEAQSKIHPAGPGEDALRFHEQLARAQERLYESQKKLLDSRRAETKEMYSQVDAAHRTVEAEEQKFQDRKAAFGKMDPGHRAAVLGIARKVQAGGKLTDSEADILDQAGFGKDITNKHWAGKVDAKAAGLLGVLGENGVNAAKEQELRVTKALAEAKQREIEAAKRLAETMDAITVNQGKIQVFDVDKDIKANQDALGELEKALTKRDGALRGEIRRVAAKIASGALS